MWKWMVKFLSKYQSRVIKFAWVNSIRMTKSINLLQFLMCCWLRWHHWERVLVFWWGHLLSFHYGLNVKKVLRRTAFKKILFTLEQCVLKHFEIKSLFYWFFFGWNKNKMVILKIGMRFSNSSFIWM